MKIKSINKEYTKSFTEIAFNVDCLPSEKVINKINDKLAKNPHYSDANISIFESKCLIVKTNKTTIDEYFLINLIEKDISDIQVSDQTKNDEERKTNEELLKNLSESLKLPIEYSFSSF